jgi:hypothetical protein
MAYNLSILAYFGCPWRALSELLMIGVDLAQADPAACE